MEVIEKEIPYKHNGAIHLYTIGDEHIGTQLFAESRLQAKITQIKRDPIAYWIGMGDKAEFISPSDPRWDAGVIANWVHEDNIAIDQSEYYCDLYTPIIDKCIGLIEGNHEDAIRIHSHIDVQKNICKHLGVPNLGYSCWVRFKFKRRSSKEAHVFDGVFTHGSGWAITKGAKMNKLERFMDAFNARLYAYAHVHDIILETGKAYLDLDAKGNIKQRTKVGAMTGCWFKTYSQGVRASYGEKRSYPPTEIGCPMFTIYPDKDILKVEG